MRHHETDKFPLFPHPSEYVTNQAERIALKYCRFRRSGDVLQDSTPMTSEKIEEQKQTDIVATAEHFILIEKKISGKCVTGRAFGIQSVPTNKYNGFFVDQVIRLFFWYKFYCKYIHKLQYLRGETLIHYSY